MRNIHFNLECAIAEQNREAVITEQEAQFLADEITKFPPFVEKRCELWNDSQREAYRSMRMEDGDEYIPTALLAPIAVSCTVYLGLMIQREGMKMQRGDGK